MVHELPNHFTSAAADHLTRAFANHAALLKDHALILGDYVDGSYNRSGIDLLWSPNTVEPRVVWYSAIYDQYQEVFGDDQPFGLVGDLLSLSPDIRQRHLQRKLSSMQQVDSFFELFFQTQALSAKMLTHLMQQTPESVVAFVDETAYPFVQTDDYVDTLLHMMLSNQLSYATIVEWQRATQKSSLALTDPSTTAVAQRFFHRLASIYHQRLQALQSFKRVKEDGGLDPFNSANITPTSASLRQETAFKQAYGIPQWRCIYLQAMDFCQAYVDYAQMAMRQGAINRQHYIAMLGGLQQNPYLSGDEKSLLQQVLILDVTLGDKLDGDSVAADASKQRTSYNAGQTSSKDGKANHPATATIHHLLQ
jgi:hypothetical protein